MKESKKPVVPDGKYEGTIVGVWARNVNGRSGQATKLVFDVEVATAQGEKAVLPFWVAPGLGGQAPLQGLLEDLGVLARVNERYPGKTAWEDEADAKELASFLAPKVKGAKIGVRVRSAISRAGEVYSLVDGVQAVPAAAHA